MKGIKLCGECANYSYKKHKCLLGCNKETDPRSKFYDDCPLPDAVEVRRGKWVQNVLFIGTHTCSVCEKDPIHYDGRTGYVEILSDFCPHCGAKMDGGENDGN